MWGFIFENVLIFQTESSSFFKRIVINFVETLMFDNEIEISNVSILALTEMKTLTQQGVYRKNGSAGQTKRLIVLFNQGKK